MKKFVVGDIHGAYKALVQVLERSGFDYENDLLVTIGDIVDGWEDSFMVVEELLKIKNRIDIVGNHDDCFYDFIEVGIHTDGWGQGGLSTALSYAKAKGIELKVVKKYPTSLRHSVKYLINLNPDDVPDTHKNFFRKQIRYYKDDNNNVFVHGGFRRNFPIGDRAREYMMWDRSLWNQALSSKNSQNPLKFHDDINKVFVGHTTTMCWNQDTPMNGSNVWNVDTGAGGGGKLTLMNVDTEEFWQSDFVKELYPDDEHNDRK